MRDLSKELREPLLCAPTRYVDRSLARPMFHRSVVDGARRVRIALVEASPPEPARLDNYKRIFSGSRQAQIRTTTRSIWPPN